jgi:hypothetical protein
MAIEIRRFNVSCGPWMAGNSSRSYTGSGCSSDQCLCAIGNWIRSPALKGDVAVGRTQLAGFSDIWGLMVCWRLDEGSAYVEVYSLIYSLVTITTPYKNKKEKPLDTYSYLQE